MLLSRRHLPVWGALLASRVAVAQNTTCNEMKPPSNITIPVYAFPQPFLPFLAPEGTQAFDDTDSAITYNGNWTGTVDATAVNSTLHVSSDPAASVSFTFTGTGIEWFGVTGPDRGVAQVSLNSTPPVVTTVDAFSNVTNEQQRIFDNLTLPFDTYTITIQNTALGFALSVDAFVVTLADVLAPPPITEADGWTLIERGLTGVSAMQITVVSPTHAIIFDKVEHNYASIGGHPAWGVLYNLNTDEVTPFQLESNSFCASGSFLSNGTLISVGGNPAAVIDTSDNAYHDVNGLQSLRIVEPCLSPEGDCFVLDMVNATDVERWYPTVLRVTDGSALIIGGGTENVYMNNITINQPSVSFFPSAPGSPVSFDMPFLTRTLNANLFVHAFSLPNERAFIISNTQSIFFDWGASPPQEEPTEYPLPNGIRVTYPMPATALMLPLSSADNYTTTILVCGGSDMFDMLCDWQYSSQHPASSQCSRIQIAPDGTTDGWQLDDPMPDGARVMPDGVMLPTGEVVIVNGARSGFSGFGSVIDPVGLSNADGPALSPIMYSPDMPAGQRWTQLGVRSEIPRLYHSVATLTPNGNIMITGSNPNTDREVRKFPAEYRVEWLNPPYMAADRPTYTGLAAVTGFGTTFTLDVDVPAGLNTSDVKVSLMDLGFSTHSMHANSRLVYLDCSLEGSTMTVEAPPDAGVYPPGPGYVFVVVDGVASTAAVTLIGDGAAPPAH
ncbi:glyoxal oxidase N-terminus-domain-containing protein [Gautieria morchelliformis]|nr:glyoxal oxidase N-terminus-domain-containing protein [Gautieria morchelliformis]